MEQISQENHQSKIVSGKNIRRYAIFTGVIILFSIPLLLLVFKPSAKRQEGPGQGTADIAALENEVRSNPGYSNLINLAVAYINSKQPSRAIAHLKEALKKDPNSSIAYNNMGVAQIMLRNYAPAIENCQKALSIDTGFALAKNNLKWAMGEKNKVIISLQELEKTPEEKRDLAFYIDESVKYLSIGAYDECIATCKKGLKKDRSNPALINNTGTALMMKKKYESAIAEFTKILDNDAGNQLAKNNIAWALDEQKLNP